MAVGLLFFVAWFYRRPRRAIPKDARVIVSPANGRVAVVKRFTKGSLEIPKWNKAKTRFLTSDVAKSGWFVLIVMAPWHVHHQRAPLAGTVLKTRHTRGRFRNAMADKAALENERNEILMQTKHGKLKVIQIAGIFARRIHCSVKKGDKLNKGEPIGLIGFGSQVALLLPEKTKLEIGAGQSVLDGQRIGVIK